MSATKAVTNVTAAPARKSPRPPLDATVWKKPDPVRVPTPAAYRWLDEARGAAFRRGAVVLELDALRTWGDVARMAGNEFESAVFGREPSVRAAFEALVATRPLVCRMSGSGSTIFAAYRTPRDRDDARMMLGNRHGTVRPVMTGPPDREGGNGG